MLPISTSLSTRSGCLVAMRSAIAPPKLLPTRWAFSMPRASMNPTVWSAQVSRPYLTPSGRSEKPKPTMSGATTWKSSASAGITSRQFAYDVTPGPEPCTSTHVWSPEPASR